MRSPKNREIPTLEFSYKHSVKFITHTKYLCLITSYTQAKFFSLLSPLSSTLSIRDWSPNLSAQLILFYPSFFY